MHLAFLDANWTRLEYQQTQEESTQKSQQLQQTDSLFTRLFQQAVMISVIGKKRQLNLRNGTGHFPLEFRTSYLATLAIARLHHTPCARRGALTSCRHCRISR